MKVSKYFLAAMIMICSTVRGQDSLTRVLAYIAVNRSLPELAIGDSMKDLPLRMVNYSDTQVSMSSFKGKLIILDFWHQFCSSCLAAFPKMEKLQEYFDQKIVILPVTFQSAKSVKDFLRKRSLIGKRISLPSIIEDTLLRKYFPHDADPYEVWINEDGKIIGKTDGYAVTESMINRVLKKDYSLLEALRKDKHDYKKPLLIDGNGGADSEFLYRSLITKFNPSLNSQGLLMVPEKTFNYQRFYNYNSSVIGLFKWALFHLIDEDFDYDIANKRIILEDLDPLTLKKWNWPDSLGDEELRQFEYDNFYSYELITPLSIGESQIYHKALADLESFFCARASIVKREMSCLVLVRTSRKDKLRTAGKEEIYERPVDNDRNLIHVFRQPIRNLSLALNAINGIPIIIDETAYKGLVDVELNLSNRSSLEEIKNALKEYDLGLNPVNRQIKVLIFKKM